MLERDAEGEKERERKSVWEIVPLLGISRLTYNEWKKKRKYNTRKNLVKITSLLIFFDVLVLNYLHDIRIN